MNEDRVLSISQQEGSFGLPVSFSCLSQSSTYENNSPKSDEGYFSPAISVSEIFSTKLLGKEVYSHTMEMDSDASPKKYQVYKVVLTGGPCGGKTTGMDRLFSFFENMGWKVFTVPETATILLGSKIKFSELDNNQSYIFQKDLLKTMLQIEDTIFNQAHLVKNRNVLVICDRGAMDPSAYMSEDEWKRLLVDLNIPEFDLINNRYNQIIHMVTAADGADQYYTVANNSSRSEGIGEAKNQDEKTRRVWLGHPYYDIVDNTECSKFEDKVLKVIQVVCDRTGVDSHDRLSKNSRKRKWLVASIDETHFAKYEEYIIRHDYLLADTSTVQVRIRSRTQINRGTSYSLTTRVFHEDARECIETRMPISFREYTRYLGMVDKSRSALYKKRRIFMVGNQYFNLDIYTDPLPPAAGNKHLMFLETYTTQPKGSSLPILPSFLRVEKEITGDSSFSMYCLAKIPGLKCERDEFIGASVYKDD